MTAKTKILLLFGLLFTSSILLVSGVGFSNFKTASTENKTVKLDNQAFLISKALEQKIERYFDVLNVMADDIEIDETGLLNINKTIQSLHIIANNLGVLDAYITTKDARSYTHQNDGLEVGFNAKEKKREWYIRAFDGEDKIITNPYVSSYGNKVTTFAVPIKRNGKVLGVFALNIGINQITSFIQELAPENNIFVSRQDGYLLAAKEAGLIGKNIYDERPSYREFKNKSISNHDYYLEDIEYTVSGVAIDSLNWTVWSWSSWDDINEASSENLQVSLWITLIFIITSLYFTYLIIMKVMYRPIGGEPAEIEAIVKRIAQGELHSVAPLTGGETGIYSAIHTMVGNLKDIIKNINTSTSQLNISSAQMSESASKVKNSSGAQIKELELTSTALNKMVATVSEVARNALYTSTVVNGADEQTTKGIHVVNDMNASISTLVEGVTNVQQVICTLEEQVENIGCIIDLIIDVSEKTNLLASNSIIEAAEVVGGRQDSAILTGEAKELANKTKDISVKIHSMLSRLQNESTNAIALIQINLDNAKLTAIKSRDVNNILEEVRRSISIIQDMNDQVATSAEQQAIVVGEVNQCITGINNIAKTAFDSAGSNTKRATELLNIAAALNKSIEVFKL